MSRTPIDPAAHFSKALSALPEETQTRVRVWIGTQLFIAKELGLTPAGWFDYVGWAIKNPLDFNFVWEISQRSPSGGGDKLESSADTTQRRAAAGVAAKGPLPSRAGTKAGLANLGVPQEMVGSSSRGAKRKR